MRISDWSSDVCSSDLVADAHARSGRAGIDHRNIASRPDDPRLGAGEGIGRRVRREHAAHQRLMLLALAGADAVGPGLFVAHATHVALRGAKKKRARRKGAREWRSDARFVWTI